MITADLYAITPEKKERHAYGIVNYEVPDDVLKMEVFQPPVESVEYFDLVFRKSGAAVPFPGSADPMDLVDKIMRCCVSATYRPQAWQDDYAVDVDGEFTFNAMPRLINLSYETLVEVADKPGASEELAVDQPGAKAHSGPFEVDIDEDEIIEMVCILAGHAGALGDGDFMRDIPPGFWDDACIAARAILKEQDQELEIPRQEVRPPQNWDDWVERFKPQPADPEDESYLMRDLDDPQVLRAISESPDRIWTSLDVDGESFISSGVHYVNRMGYYLCDVPYKGPMCDFPEDDDAADTAREPRSWGELSDRFEPQPLPVARDPGNLLRSADDAELRVAVGTDPCRVWTVLNLGGDEKIVNGFHETSGAAYILCNIPYDGPDCEIEGDAGPVEHPRERG